MEEKNLLTKECQIRPDAGQKMLSSYRMNVSLRAEWKCMLALSQHANHYLNVRDSRAKNSLTTPYKSDCSLSFIDERRWLINDLICLSSASRCSLVNLLDSGRIIWISLVGDSVKRESTQSGQPMRASLLGDSTGSSDLHAAISCLENEIRQ